jgi:murein DD-endopeptidase MepM/ murein hydrolase activator NlpD
MDPVDFLNRRLNNLLPGNHRWVLLGLLGFLLVITHDNDYAGESLLLRNSQPELAETSSLDNTSEKLAVIETTENTGNEQHQDLPTNLTAPEVPSQKSTSQTTLSRITIEAGPTPDFVTEVKPGDNLSLIFARAGLSPRDVYEVSHSKPQTPILANLFPGYSLEFSFDDNKELESLAVVKSQLEKYVFTRIDEDSYGTEQITRDPEVRQVFREAEIDDSLFLAARRGGMSAGVTMELAGIFGGVIDFLLDTRRGDTFNLLYEEKYLNGEYLGYGRILAAQFTNQGDTYTAVRYVNSDGEVDFYNPDGESMRKAFLRNTVDFTRISSNFTLSRKHPILNTIRAHKGTDYAAPRGTPVVAAGDGRVTWAGRNGSFGKLIVIQHGERFQTKYAHLNDYANGVKKGKRIKQGDIIGYVGTTGGATGPHLHYEFLMDGVHRNSRTIHDQLPKAKSVSPSELQRFEEHTQILLSQLENHVSNTRNIAQHTVTTE